MTDLAGDVTALINRLSVVQAQRDTARQELATARAEVERLTSERSWISVSDALPEQVNGSDSGNVLVFTAPLGSMYVAFYIYEERIWCEGHQCEEIGNITHWMPLPQPPAPDTRPDDTNKE